MNRPARLETQLLLIGFVFQAFAAAALLLAPSVQSGSWVLSGASLVVLIPLAGWGILAWIVHLELDRHLPERDPLLFPAAMFLAGWGLQILIRLAPAMALRQTLWLALGCSVLVLLVRLPRDLEWFAKYRYLWLLGALAAVAATFFVGVGSAENSPRLWLGLAVVFFQPSEFLRWIFPAFAAFTLAAGTPGSAVPRRDNTLPVLIFGAISVGLLLLQQDLGAAFLLLAAVILAFFLARRKWFVLALGAAAIALAGVLGFWLDPVIHARILTWWNPWLDAGNTSYQVVQSLIAVASGGIIGRGPGLGAPGLVPVSFSDFIFAGLSEEYGVVGALGCLLIVSILVLRALRAAARSPDSAGRLLAGTLGALLGLQSILIIGGELRLLPLTGVTLPWMSYGGSSLLSSAIVLALLLIVSAKGIPERAAPAEDRPVNFLAGLQIFAALAVAVSLGWWGIYRAPVLRTRTDNARRVIHDQQARRGNLYDRNGNPLALTAGEPGDYLRRYPDPAAAPVVGYNSALYGQGGLEAALDPWLRGEASHDAFSTWWSETVLGIPAEGSSAQLTIDRGLQDFGAGLLGNRAGAIVVMRARSGEILALVSEPTYNPGALERDWSSLLDNPRSPLLNRATQGLYPPGFVFEPFLVAEALDQELLPAATAYCDLSLQSLAAEHPDLAAQAFARFLFNEAPMMDLPAAYHTLSLWPPNAPGLVPAAGESDQTLVSPMQVALALASLSANGTAPAPILVWLLEESGGWVRPEPPGHAVAMTTSDLAAETVALMGGVVPGSSNLVEIPSCGGLASGNPGVSWYAGFQMSEGDDVVVVVVVEGNEPGIVSIGRQMIGRAEKID